MATENKAGISHTNPGRVKPNGVNKLENAASDTESFSITNGSSVAVSSAANVGQLKLEWQAEGEDPGAKFGVFIAGSLSTNYRYLGELQFCGGRSLAIPTFATATTKRSVKPSACLQNVSIPVANDILLAVDGGDFIQVRIVPRNNVGAIIYAMELTYTS